MYAKEISIFGILSFSIATVIMGTAGMNLVSPAFAGGDHHDRDGKKCKDNGDDSCNETHKTQKINSKVECNNESKIHGDDNTAALAANCEQSFANLKEVEQTNSTAIGDVFGSGF